jgi:hypothetical protein
MEQTIESTPTPIEPQPEGPFWAPFIEPIEPDRSIEAFAGTTYCIWDENGLDWGMSDAA